MEAVLSVTSSAPGKVILFGEHAVVYGVSAVACCLSDLRTEVSVNVKKNENAEQGGVVCVQLVDIVPGGVKLSVPLQALAECDQECHRSAANEYDPNPVGAVDNALKDRLDALVECLVPEGTIRPAKEALTTALYLCAKVLLICGSAIDSSHPLYGTETALVVQSKGLPIGAGLGSSAAFSVASSGALVSARMILFAPSLNEAKDSESLIENELIFESEEKTTLRGSFSDTVNKWAYVAEKIIHGTPSGLDNTISTYGGTLSFKKVNGSPTFQRLGDCPPLRILLTNTKVPRVTRQLVANVRKLREEDPDMVNGVFDEIQKVTDTFESSLKDDGLHNIVSKLFETNQQLLETIGVSHPSLETICNSSRKVGLSSKLTGAGGGGCAVTFLGVAGEDATPDLESLKSELSTSHGYDCFESEIGGVGVKVSVSRGGN